MRRLAAATTILAILALLILFIPAQSWAQQGQRRPVAGEVSRVQGAAAVLRAGAPVALAVGDAVYSGDALETGEDARLELSMADGTVLTLGGATRLDLTGYVWMEEAGAGMASLRLGKGAFRAVTGALTRAIRPRFTVDTPLAEIGIRGTDFWGGFLRADALDVLFVAGDKRIEVTNSQGTTVLEAPGQGLTVPLGKAPGSMKVWGETKRTRAFDTVRFGAIPKRPATPKTPAAGSEY